MNSNALVNAASQLPPGSISKLHALLDSTTTCGGLPGLRGANMANLKDELLGFSAQGGWGLAGASGMCNGTNCVLF